MLDGQLGVWRSAGYGRDVLEVWGVGYPGQEEAIAGVLEKHVFGERTDDNGGESVQDYGLVRNIAGQCPDCGGLLAYEEGCFKCHGCGYTKC